MPRIRKKTSKRISTHQRAKIKHKVAEGRKKNKKAAKKNPQWKSKKKKDPGIPNNFPYKDQILAEIAETRRQAEEAKQRRKEEKKAARDAARVDAGMTTGEVEDLVSGGEDKNEGIEVETGDMDTTVPTLSSSGRSAADMTSPSPVKKVTFAVGTPNRREKKLEARSAAKVSSKKPIVGTKADSRTPKISDDAYDFNQFFKP